MTTQLNDRCLQLVRELGLGYVEDVTDITPLTGGVASDIAALTLGGRRICVKFALPKLKVAADWYAPVHRNAAEYAWLETAAKITPNSAVKLFGRSEKAHGFAMEFVAGPDVYLWKTALLDGQICKGEAARIGGMIGQIHAASTEPGFEDTPFQNQEDFRALRIEPYLSFTASKHPDIARALTKLADRLFVSKQVLTHGDVSPKNILIRPHGPVILDAECATIGDASFDPSFCLNHLALKAYHLPNSRPGLLAEMLAFWQGYVPHISWESRSDLETRICLLLPALMLARIDGKSPVEYLSERERSNLRTIAIDMIKAPETTLSNFVSTLDHHMKERSV